MASPFREEHQQFRKTVRQFAEKELMPFIDEWEKAEIFPNEVFKRAGELGMVATRLAVARDCTLPARKKGKSGLLRRLPR